MRHIETANNPTTTTLLGTVLHICLCYNNQLIIALVLAPFLDKHHIVVMSSLSSWDTLCPLARRLLYITMQSCIHPKMCTQPCSKLQIIYKMCMPIPYVRGHVFWNEHIQISEWDMTRNRMPAMTRIGISGFSYWERQYSSKQHHPSTYTCRN